MSTIAASRPAEHSRRGGLRIRLTPRRRHLAAIITIALSTAFVAVMVLAGGLLRSSMSADIDDRMRGADLVAAAPAGDESGPAGTLAPQIPGAVAVWPQGDLYATARSAALDAPAFITLSVDPPAAAGGTPIAEGRDARAGNEIVIDPTAADRLRVGVGDEITLPAEYSPTGAEQRLTVVGISRGTQAGAIGGGYPRIHLNQANTDAIAGPGAFDTAAGWSVALEDGADAQAVAAASTTDGMDVMTVEEARESQLDTMMRGAAALGLILGVFVLIALITAAVVIANTFAVTLAQRVRSLALLRTLGAQRRQVARVVLRESLAVGLIGSALGVVIGHALVQALLAGALAVGWLHGLLWVPMSAASVLLPVAAGLVVTLGAGMGPVRAATRVAPLEALRPAPDSGGHAGGRLGLRGILGLAALVVGLALLGGGVALSHAGSTGGGTLLGVAGGALSFFGILVALVRVTAPLARLSGAVIGRLGGLPARIAAANTTRSPRRSAATIAALLIGTTLMTMMAVGSQSASQTLTTELASRKPVDIVVTAESMPADAAEELAGVRGVGDVAAVRRGDVQVGADEPMTVYGATGAQLDAVANRDDLGSLLRDDELLLGAERADRFGVHNGQELRITGADGAEHTVRVRVDGNLQMTLVTPATLEHLVAAPTPVLLARFAEPGSADRGDADGISISTGVQDLAAGEGWQGADANGGAGIEREMYGKTLGTLLGITIGLLAVAVIVALVGVANTLSLGVIERTGENALLRALGTTRRQMRAMLGWEGVLLALVGAVLGIGLGTVYGILGIHALLGSAFPVIIAIPWAQIGAVLVLAVLAGWAASVLPARRAARTAPAQALAARD